MVSSESENQSIRLWPGHLGGQSYLNLDNVARLEFLKETSKTGLLLALSPTVVEIPNPISGNNEITLQGNTAKTNPRNNAEFYFKDFITITPNSPTYIFDLGSIKSRNIEINGRSFTVTLNKIIKHNIPEVSSAIEYDFGISEL